MAFHHVALYRWQSGTPQELIDPIAPALLALSETLPGLRSYACGPSTRLTDTSYDFGVVVAFEDRRGWDAYMSDPEHDRIRFELISPIVAERAGIQFES